MKNLLVCFMLIFAFVVVKLGNPGQSAAYVGKDGKETDDIAEAKVFDSIGEAYDYQKAFSGEWKIVTVDF